MFGISILEECLQHGNAFRAQETRLTFDLTTRRTVTGRYSASASTLAVVVISALSLVGVVPAQPRLRLRRSSIPSARASRLTPLICTVLATAIEFESSSVQVGSAAIRGLSHP